MSDEKTELERVEEFYRFLQGEIPENIHMSKGYSPKMTAKRAFSIIWFLQEQSHLISDTIERCSNCDSLFDSQAEGLYWETKQKHYCGACTYLVPINYDRGKK